MSDPLVRRSRPLVGLVVVVALAAGLLWVHPGAVFLLFASLLYAIGATTAGRLLGAKLGLPSRAVAVALTFATLFALAGAAVAIGKPFVAQVGQLAAQSPRLFHTAIDHIWRLPWVATLLGSQPQPSEMLQVGQQALQSVPTLASGAFEVLATVVVWFFVALYLTLDPEGYAKGALRLFAPSRRGRVRASREYVEEYLGDLGEHEAAPKSASAQRPSPLPRRPSIA